MLNGSENREIECSNICVGRGVSHRLTKSTKVYVNRERETTALKRWNVDEGGDSQVMQLPSKAAVKSSRRIYVMLNVAGITVDVFSQGLRADFLFELSLTIL